MSESLVRTLWCARPAYDLDPLFTESTPNARPPGQAVLFGEEAQAVNHAKSQIGVQPWAVYKLVQTHHFGRLG